MGFCKIRNYFTFVLYYILYDLSVEEMARSILQSLVELNKQKEMRSHKTQATESEQSPHSQSFAKYKEMEYNKCKLKTGLLL